MESNKNGNPNPSFPPASADMNSRRCLRTYLSANGPFATACERTGSIQMTHDPMIKAASCLDVSNCKKGIFPGTHEGYMRDHQQNTRRRRQPLYCHERKQTDGQLDQPSSQVLFRQLIADFHHLYSNHHPSQCLVLSANTRRPSGCHLHKQSLPVHHDHSTGLG